jgi:hypothetical protein
MAFNYPRAPQGDPLSDSEQDVLCQEILAEIQTGRFKPAGEAHEENRSHWEQVWALQGWKSVPPYLRSGDLLRVNQHFLRTQKRSQELYWYKRLRSALLSTYFKNVPGIYEFGCGSGWNLLAAHDLYPTKKLVGLDWAQSAVDRLNGLGPYWQGERIRAKHFDFFHPDYALKLEPNSGVWTVWSLEQTGKDWGAFLEYLLDQRPACCVHVEPIVEWYDPKNPVDATAILYHRARKYWEGFPDVMDDLQAQGKVEILEKQRAYLGSKYLEACSLFVWRPL